MEINMEQINKGMPAGTACLYQSFAEQAVMHPNRIAVSDEHSSLTYKALKQKADLASHRLYASGVRTGNCVALILPRNCEQIIHVLAILQLGACYVPIDPDYPKERIDWIIACSQPSAIVTQRELSKTLWGNDSLTKAMSHLLFVEDQFNFVPDEHEKPVYRAAGAFAYIIFTSGSTGNPKGVVVGHQQVLALINAAMPLLDATHTDVWALFHSLAFDFSVWEVWGALTTGAKLTIIPKSVIWSPDALVQYLRAEKVTILNQTPSAFYALIDAESKALKMSEQPLCLRKVIFGGEALNLDKVKKWWQLYSCETLQLINMYGITETTVHVTSLTLSDSLCGTENSPIGEGLASLEVLLLDENLEKVADGEIGEIYIAGEQVAFGYINRPDLTAMRFVASPFHAGKRMYRSGDLAKQLDGQLFYFGRADRQLKVRGFRIEPSEIEVVLESHAKIQRAAVIAKPCLDSGLSDGLIAILIATEESFTAQPIATLRNYLSQHLPVHYLPSDFLFVKKFPLTVNGKLDEKALLMQWQASQKSTFSLHQQRLELLRLKQQDTLAKSTT
jgi:nonribosomal peptide synthetase DhbF